MGGGGGGEDALAPVVRVGARDDEAQLFEGAHLTADHRLVHLERLGQVVRVGLTGAGDEPEQLVSGGLQVGVDARRRLLPQQPGAAERDAQPPLELRERVVRFMLGRLGLGQCPGCRGHVSSGAPARHP